jgi:hypothetical protein
MLDTVATRNRSFATKPLGRQFKVIVPILKEAKAEYAKLQ